MVFVTVGNATQEFGRLLHAVDTLAGSEIFQHYCVFIQTGHNRDFHPRHCEYAPFLSLDEFQLRMEKADLIISHGGCTQLHAIRLGKIPVVMPRRRKYHEHVNDHQMQLVRALSQEGKVIAAYEPHDLPAAVVEAASRRLDRISRPSSPMLALVMEAMEQVLSPP